MVCKRTSGPPLITSKTVAKNHHCLSPSNEKLFPYARKRQKHTCPPCERLKNYVTTWTQWNIKHRTLVMKKLRYQDEEESNSGSQTNQVPKSGSQTNQGYGAPAASSFWFSCHFWSITRSKVVAPKFYKISQDPRWMGPKEQVGEATRDIPRRPFEYVAMP